MKRWKEQKKEDPFTYIEYIQDRDTFRLSYFREHETANAARVSSFKYNIYEENQHYTIPVRKELIETLKMTSKNEDEYIDCVNDFLNSL